MKNAIGLLVNLLAGQARAPLMLPAPSRGWGMEIPTLSTECDGRVASNA